MAGFKDSVTAFGLTIQPVAGTYNEPNNTTDLLPVGPPDNGSDIISADDPTVTGAVWNQPRQFLGRRGRAGASCILRGPGGASPPAPNAWGIGRVLQGAGFTELVNPTAITGVSQAGGSTNQIALANAAVATDDFYQGMPIQHANIGTADTIKGTSLIRDYIGSSKLATLSETVAAAIVSGTYRIPPSLTYALSTGISVPLLSAKVWRHRKAYRYRDCAINSFAINIPVANDQNTDFPTIEFGMVGVPVISVDEIAPNPPQSLLTPPPAAKAGKFVFNGLKLGHQTMRLEFGLETGAPPNQNFDQGQESYEILSGTRTMSLDLNENLIATLDLDSLVDTQTMVPVLSGWGQNAGNRFLVGVFNSLLDPFSPNPRNGFVGVAGQGSPTDIDRALSLCCMW